MAWVLMVLYVTGMRYILLFLSHIRQCKEHRVHKLGFFLVAIWCWFEAKLQRKTTKIADSVKMSCIAGGRGNQG